MPEKYDVHDKWGRKVGTFEKTPPDAGPIGCIILAFLLVFGSALFPILFGGWLLLDWENRSKNQKSVWVLSCIFIPLIAAIITSGYVPELEWIPYIYPLIFIPVGIIAYFKI